MEQRRIYGRVKTQEKITCQVQKEDGSINLSGLLVTDISPAGFCFISNEEIPKNTILKLRLNFPVAYRIDNQFPSSIKVVYCSQITHPKKFKVGCCYIRPSKGGFHGR